MADLGPLWPAAGGASVVLAREVWAWLRSRRSPEELAAKDRLIAVLEADNERLRTERDGALARIAALGTQLERERIQVAGVTRRILEDPKTDDALVDDMPTAVRDRAALLAPKKSLPPGVKDELVTYQSDMASTPPGAYRPKLPSRRG